MALMLRNALSTRLLHGPYRNQSSTWLGRDKLFCQPLRIFHNSHSKRKQLDSRLWNYFQASERGVAKLKHGDKISRDYTLIYKAPMESTMKFGYPVVLLTLLGAPTVMLYHFYSHGEILLKKEAHSISFLNPEVEVWIFTLAIALFTWAVCAVTFKYPFRVYKHRDNQEYIAMFLSAVPLKLRQFNFRSATQTTFRNPLYFFMDNCHFFLDGKKKAFLLGHYFRTPADLCEMLGMD